MISPAIRPPSTAPGNEPTPPMTTTTKVCTRIASPTSGDTDTTGAVAGALAGAAYGASTIPSRWLDLLQYRDELTTLSDQLLERSLAFARGAGQVQDARVQQAIAEVIQSGGKATMVMLGQSVLADRPGDGNNASLWTACQIDDEGTRWL